MANRRGKQANPGAELRAIRQQLGWSMREVHTESLAVSTNHRQPAFVIPRTDFHCDDFGRSALCSIFRTNFECAENYGNFAGIPSLLCVPRLMFCCCSLEARFGFKAESEKHDPTKPNSAA
jgi:hypothetical protein